MNQTVKKPRQPRIKKIVALPSTISRDVSTMPVLTPLTYRGGQLLTQVEMFTIFWGKDWTTPVKAAMIAPFNKFFKDIVDSTLIDQLAEYNVPNQKIGHGSFIGGVTTNSPSLAKTVSDTTIKKISISGLLLALFHLLQPIASISFLLSKALL